MPRAKISESTLNCPVASTPDHALVLALKDNVPTLIVNCLAVATIRRQTACKGVIFAIDASSKDLQIKE